MQPKQQTRNKKKNQRRTQDKGWCLMPVHLIARFLATAFLVCFATHLFGQQTKGLPNPHSKAFLNRFGALPSSSLPGDRQIADWFKSETERLSSLTQSAPKPVAESDQQEMRLQLAQMLGLWPEPERTPLHATVTGTVDHPDFTVEKLHFQSRPGLFCTANVYVPRKKSGPVPAILYLCGHGRVAIDGVSYGNKTYYQHHGAWFARNGYVCLVLDSVQLGEIEGLHHGTHHLGMWWWNSRGYTPAGAEAWNCIRAIDYLQSREDVDAERIGVTGRSGGGAYSWWTAALDRRVKVACPVAGITDLQNHVIDGCVEGHCDCMFMANSFCWDYWQVASLVAPRPLLICNTDKDYIFPLDGVVRIHEQVRSVYSAHKADDRLGLVVTEGGHADTQEIQVPVMRWFNRWLKNDTSPVANLAEKLFTPQQLKVFQQLPSEEWTSRCHERYLPEPILDAGASSATVQQQLSKWTFAAWPKARPLGESTLPRLLGEQDLTELGLKVSVLDFDAGSNLRLRYYRIKPTKSPIQSVKIELLDTSDWIGRFSKLGEVVTNVLQDEVQIINAKARAIPLDRSEAIAELRRMSSELNEQGCELVLFAPRGIGSTTNSGDEAYQTHLRRRYNLLGSTQASWQVWDTLQLLGIIAKQHGDDFPMRMIASTEMTEVACFVALFSDDLQQLHLRIEPRDDRTAPDFYQWLRIVSPKKLAAIVAEKTKLIVD
jgi:dienelactone hydrolase